MAVRTGGSGADVFDASLLDDYDETNQYSGNSGDDTLIGGALKDRLVGGEGSDVLAGDDGSDTLIDRGVSGSDSLDGGEGDDNVEGRYGADTLIGGAGHDTITFGFGSMLVSGGTGDDTFISIGQGPASATITGGAGDDVLYAGASADSFDGGQGEDLVDYSAARTGIVVNFQTGATGGGAAGDTFRFVEDVVGTSRADVIVGNGFNNILFGGAGDDTLGGGLDGDYLDGGDGLDVADLGAGGSTGVVADLAAGSFTGGGADGDTLINIEGVAGSEFNDVITGDGAANRLIGRGGADILDGGSGVDTMTGGAGDDRYFVDNSNDFIIEAEAEGIDTVVTTFNYKLAGSFLENLTLVGPSALKGTGNALANTITGNEFNNVLDGGGGADSLYGGGGGDTYHIDSVGDRAFDTGTNGVDKMIISVDDFFLESPAIERVTLAGTADLDLTVFFYPGEIIGNAGANRFTIDDGATITGGAGADTFYYRGPAGGEVTDFVVGEDSFQLNRFGFALNAGPLNPNLFKVTNGPAASGPDVRIFYDQIGGGLYIDRDGGGFERDPELIAKLDPGLDLSAGDFVVV